MRQDFHLPRGDYCLAKFLKNWLVHVQLLELLARFQQSIVKLKMKKQHGETLHDVMKLYLRAPVPEMNITLTV